MTVTAEITPKKREELITIKVTKTTQTGLRLLKSKKDKSMQAILDELVEMEIYRLEREEEGKKKKTSRQ